MIKINITKTKQLLQDKVEWSSVLKIINSKKYCRIHDIKHLDIHKDINTVIKLYEECDWPFYKIAMLCGVSDVTVKKWCVQNGVKNKSHQRGLIIHQTIIFQQ